MIQKIYERQSIQNTLRYFTGHKIISGYNNNQNMQTQISLLRPIFICFFFVVSYLHLLNRTTTEMSLHINIFYAFELNNKKHVYLRSDVICLFLSNTNTCTNISSCRYSFHVFLCYSLFVPILPFTL